MSSMKQDAANVKLISQLIVPTACRDIPCGDVSHDRFTLSCFTKKRLFLADLATGSGLLFHSDCPSIKLSRAMPLTVARMEELRTVAIGPSKQVGVGDCDQDAEEYSRVEDLVIGAVTDGRAKKARVKSSRGPVTVKSSALSTSVSTSVPPRNLYSTHSGLADRGDESFLGWSCRSWRCAFHPRPISNPKTIDLGEHRYGGIQRPKIRAEGAAAAKYGPI